MLAYIKGQIKKIASSFIIIEVNNLGYKIFIPSSLLSNLKESQIVELYLHHHISENASDLYGFASFQQLELYKLLLNVSGVGPKSALSIIDLGTVEQIYNSIKQENIAFISSASGIGSKTAAKVILELKNKITNLPINIPQQNYDLLDALLSLGYTKYQIKNILSEIDVSTSLPEQVKQALQLFGKNKS